MIEIFDSYPKFEKYLYFIINKFKKIWVNPKFNKSMFLNFAEWILQEYQIDPYLFEGRKFHIRPLVLIYQKDNIIKGYLHQHIPIITAFEKYKNDDWKNKRIHDTHFGSTPRMLLLANDGGLNNHQMEKLRNDLKDLISFILNKLKEINCFEESQKCFNIFGTDIIFDKNLTPKVMEVQMKSTSYGMRRDDNFSLCDLMFKESVDIVVEDYFPSKNNQSIENNSQFELFFTKEISLDKK